MGLMELILGIVSVVTNFIMFSVAISLIIIALEKNTTLTAKNTTFSNYTKGNL